MKPADLHFFIDPNRCIGCQACVQACSECDTHRGESMIHLEYIARTLCLSLRFDRNHFQVIAGREHGLIA